MLGSSSAPQAAAPQRGLAPPGGAGAWDLIWGDFSSVQGIPGAQLLCRQWERVRDLGFGLLSGTGLCPSPLPGFPSNLTVVGGFFWCFVFPWLSPLAVGVCWELRSGCLPSRGDGGLCGGVRRCPRGGRRGREGPGDGIAFLLLPRPGKEATSRVSTGPWEGVQTCVSSCTWACEQAFLSPGLMLLPPEEPTGFSAGRALLFLSPFVPILLASGTAFTSSLSPSVSMDGSKLSVQLLSVPPVPCPLFPALFLAGRCHRVRASSAGSGAFREPGLRGREFGGIAQ